MQPCKPCRVFLAGEWAYQNKEKTRASKVKWASKAGAKKYFADWYQRNKHKRDKAKNLASVHRSVDKRKAEGRYIPYHKAHPDRAMAQLRARQAGLRTASVGWRNDFFISEAYDLARRRSESTGFKWEVDHIVPLRSPLVCGLHCEQNIAVIPKRDNIAKSNKFWPDMP